MEKLLSETKKETETALGELKTKIINYKEPDSVRVLETMIDQEREYIQQ